MCTNIKSIAHTCGCDHYLLSAVYDLHTKAKQYTVTHFNFSSHILSESSNKQPENAPINV